MKIELVKIDGKTIGWDIVAETEPEKRTLGSMRNKLFWGSGKDVIQYAGMSTDPEDPNYVKQLRFRTKEHEDEERNRLMNEG